MAWRLFRCCHVAGQVTDRNAAQKRDRVVARGGRLSTTQKQVVFFSAVIALILYGSLYPFEFRIPLNGRGAWSTLLSGWSSRPGRADFIANVLLYVPFGWFGMGSLPRRVSTGLRLVLVGIAGGVLSVTVELTQYFDVGRVTTASDVYGNLLGAIAGSLCFASLSESFPVSPFVRMNQQAVPVALIASWAGYRFYPYVPTADVHRYWAAVAPVFHHSSANIIDVVRHAVVWMVLIFFGRLLSIKKIGAWFDLATVLFILLIRVILLDAPLSSAEVIGAVAAGFLSPLLRMLGSRQQAAVLFVGLWSITIVGRLQPFQFQPSARDFGWLPFRSFLAGSIDVAITTFCEKTFLYGSLLFLLNEAGCGAIAAAVTVAGSLFATSWLETRLPGRSAEITDAVMALLLAAGIAVAGAPRADSALLNRFRFGVWSRVLSPRPSEQKRRASCSPTATPTKSPIQTTD
jgi:glycopeptide antibiotics resistance protein